MTDKIQKIREEVERVKTVHYSASLKDSKPDILAVQVCINLLSFIDSLQEEPKKKCMYSNDNYTNEDRQVLCDGCEELCKYNSKTAAESLGISQEEYDKIVDECIYGKEPELVDADDLLNKKEEPTSWLDELSTMLDSMSKEDFKKVFDKYAIDFNEESVSDDLEREVNIYINENDLQKLDNIRISDGFVYVKVNNIEDIARHFAEWQRKKIMKDAVETDVLNDGVDLLTTESWDEMSQYLHKIGAKAGDKVKICLIKEE